MESVPFSRAVAVTPVRPGGVGRFRVDLLRAWEADGAKQHGGVLLAVATSAALAALAEQPPSRSASIPGWQPLAVSVVFVRAGSTGVAEVNTEVLGAIDHGVPDAEAPVAVVRSMLSQ